MSDSQKLLRNSLLFGGMWGITEATLGYLLHFLPMGFSGMIMFPIGFYFMFNAFKTTGKQSAIFYTAIIAAAIKCADVVLPATTAIRVVNPVVSIILESLVVFAFVKVYRENRHYGSAFAISLGWILLLVITQALIFKPAEGLYLMPVFEMIGFMAMNTIVSGLLVGSYLVRPAGISIRFNNPNFSLSQPALIIVLAVVCEIANSLI
ncbi:hypothetical protein KJ762_04105 [bacterium]|nr:hypothetical protein [bacterium]MBU1063933.1 hypothetical protein [bacterium]MBU1633676.1 hypothetical protein [bacterium]MBU1875003.1 hypothetical protein [bacterium]